MSISPAKAKKLLEQRQKSKFNPTTLLEAAFDKQQAFINDPAKLKVLFCTRRASKSYSCGLYMLYEALINPGCNCVFVGLTRQSARGIIWKDVLKVIDRQFKLKAKFNEHMLTMTLPNGSVLSVMGADSSEEEMLKLLGRKYRLACIDEASMYTINMHQLVYGILRPAMVDPNAGGDRGTIVLAGTASNYTRGLFFDITTGKEPGWSIHTWSAHDNPHVRVQWQEELDDIDRQRPLFKETPLYKQWYLNEWVIDSEKLVYKLNPERNIYTDLPKGLSAAGWNFTLGCDLGWEDDSAFVLCATHEHDPTLYVVDTFNKKHMTFDDVTAKIREYMLDPIRTPSKIIIDGAAKQGVESMKIRSSIPFVYADKQGKVDFIELLNNDLVQAKVKIHSSCTSLIDEMMGLIWKSEGDKIAFPKREHPSLPNHLCDAFLYAWRNGYHYAATKPDEDIPKYSRRWYEQQAQDIWEREAEHIRRQEDGGYPGWGDEH